MIFFVPSPLAIHLSSNGRGLVFRALQYSAFDKSVIGALWEKTCQFSIVLQIAAGVGGVIFSFQQPTRAMLNISYASRAVAM